MKLTVKQAAREDVYRDLIRIPEKYRLDYKEKPITEGAICRIAVKDKSIYAILRGCGTNKERYIYIDERLRNRLDIQSNQEVDFIIKRVGLWGQFMWAWNSSDPAYRIAARLGLLSVVLGILSLFITIVSIFSN